MFPGGAEFEIEIMGFIVDFTLISGRGIVGFFGEGEYLVTAGFTRAPFVGCFFSFSL